jgi:hypothetical protein
MRLILLAMLLTVSLPMSATASQWQRLGFDGNAFAAGAGSAAIMVRDGYLPVAEEAAVPREDQLPKRTGALAILCYLQQSAGKLKNHPATAPMAGVLVTVAKGSLTVAGRTDASGYFILALPPGSYQVTVLGYTKKVVVEKDKTALAAFRSGKRMVD